MLGSIPLLALVDALEQCNGLEKQAGGKAEFVKALVDRGRSLLKSTGEGISAAGKNLTNAVASAKNYYLHFPKINPYYRVLQKDFYGVLPEEAGDYLRDFGQRYAKEGKRLSLDNLPAQVYHIAERSGKLPLTLRWANEMNPSAYAKYSLYELKELEAALENIASRSKIFAGIAYRNLVKNGMDPEILRKVSKDLPWEGLEYQLPKLGFGDRFMVATDKLFPLTRAIAKTTTKMYAPVDKLGEAASRLSNRAASGLANSLLLTEPRSLKDIRKFRKSIIDDPNSPITKFDPHISVLKGSRNDPNAYIRWDAPDTMWVSPRTMSSLGVMAHEYGHSVDPTTWFGRWAKKRYFETSPLFSEYSPLQNLFYKAPEEFRASWNGFRKLQSEGYGLRHALRAFSGVPSYVAPGLARLGVYTGLGTGAGYGIYKGVPYAYNALRDLIDKEK